MTIATLFVAPMLAALAAGRQAPATPAGAVQAFYAAYHAKTFSGLPHAAELAGIRTLLSPGLVRLIKVAGVKQARCIKARPDEKGPWVEGDLFTSNFEGFTKFTPGAARVTGTRVRVPVDFEYTENGQTFKWQDQVVVVKVGGRWVVDDVRYRKADGKFTSGFGTSLRRSLAGDGACG